MVYDGHSKPKLHQGRTITVILTNTSSRVIIYYIHLDRARTVMSLKLSNTRINENYLCVPTFSI